MGISKRTWYSLERGERVPDLLEAERLAAATGTSVEFLLGATSAAVPQTPILPSPLPIVNEEDAA